MHPDLLIIERNYDISLLTVKIFSAVIKATISEETIDESAIEKACFIFIKYINFFLANNLFAFAGC